MTTYTDVIVHCKDTESFVTELKNTASCKMEKSGKEMDRVRMKIDSVDSEKPKLKILKSNHGPKNGKETLRLHRANAEDLVDLETFDNLTILGTYEEVFTDPAKRAIYDRVYDQTTIDVNDVKGRKTMYTPPERFVVFQ